MTNVESSLPGIDLIHCLKVTADNTDILDTIRKVLNNSVVEFKVIRIDTGESRSSIMSIEQYGAYWTTFAL